MKYESSRYRNPVRDIAEVSGDQSFSHDFTGVELGGHIFFPFTAVHLPSLYPAKT